MLIHLYYAAGMQERLLAEVSDKLPSLLERAGLQLGAMYDIQSFPRQHRRGDRDAAGVHISIVIWGDIPTQMDEEKLTSNLLEALRQAVPCPVYGKIKLIGSKVIEPASFVADLG